MEKNIPDIDVADDEEFYAPHEDFDTTLGRDENDGLNLDIPEEREPAIGFEETEADLKGAPENLDLVEVAKYPIGTQGNPDKEPSPEEIKFKQQVQDGTVETRRATAVVPGGAPTGYKDKLQLAEDSLSKVDQIEAQRTANILATVPRKYQAQALAIEKTKAMQARAVVQTHIQGLGQSAFAKLDTNDKYKAEQLAQSTGLDLIRASEMSVKDTHIKKVANNIMSRYVNAPPEQYGAVENELFGRIVNEPGTNTPQKNPATGMPLRVGGIIQPNQFGVLEIADEAKFNRIAGEQDARDKYEQSPQGVRDSIYGGGSKGSTSGGPSSDVAKIAKSQMAIYGGQLKEIKSGPQEMDDAGNPIPNPRVTELQKKYDAAERMFTGATNQMLRERGADIPIEEPTVPPKVGSTGKPIPTIGEINKQLSTIANGRSDIDVSGRKAEYLKSIGAPIIKVGEGEDPIQKLLQHEPGLVVVQNPDGTTSAQEWVGKDAWADEVLKRVNPESDEKRLSSIEKSITGGRESLRYEAPVKFDAEGFALFDVDKVDRIADVAREHEKENGSWDQIGTNLTSVGPGRTMRLRGNVREKYQAKLDKYNTLVKVQKTLGTNLKQAAIATDIARHREKKKTGG